MFCSSNLQWKLECTRFPEICTFFVWTQRNWEFRCHRKWSLNRQFQCQSMKNYRAQTPHNLVLTKILQNCRKNGKRHSLRLCLPFKTFYMWRRGFISLTLVRIVVNVATRKMKQKGFQLLETTNSNNSNTVTTKQRWPPLTYLPMFSLTFSLKYLIGVFPKWCCDMDQSDTIGKIELIPLPVLSSVIANCKNDIQ